MTIAPAFVAHSEPALALPEGAVGVWVVPTIPTRSASTWGFDLLSPVEQARAAAMQSIPARARFVVVRSALRTILGSLLGVDPRLAPVADGPTGKPLLAGAGSGGLRFNVSHAGDLGVIAVAVGREVGVDIEHARPWAGLDRIVTTCFSEREQAELATVPASERATAFLNGWTGKEAVLKALGIGIARPMRSVEVTLAPRTAPRILAIEDDLDAAGRWTLHRLDGLPAGYVGSLAVEGAAGDLRYGHWNAPQTDWRNAWNGNRSPSLAPVGG